MAHSLVCFLFLLSSQFRISYSASPDPSFDVRTHLSTVTRYDLVTSANNVAVQSFSPPNECSVFHLNFLARHGTRSPTKKWMAELDRLGIRLMALLGDADSAALDKVPGWLFGWKSPWHGKKKGGELVQVGENELYHLGIRTSERFSDLFEEEYHPGMFSIRATQAPRASASAVSIGMGLLSDIGSLGLGKHRAFSVISESRASDTCLRFYETCKTYKEASLLDIIDQPCGLFNRYVIALLEWTDDLEAFILKGYGNPLNYRSAVPLLLDIIQSMEQAIMAKEENLAPGTFEKAILRFAHAETVIPFPCTYCMGCDNNNFCPFEVFKVKLEYFPGIETMRLSNVRNFIIPCTQEKIVDPICNMTTTHSAV